MRITKKSEYALRALIEIGLSDGGVVRAQDIAAREAISLKFLEQVLLPLRHQGVLEARRGPNGGYILNRPAESITLAEVIRLVDGPLAPVGCVSKLAYTPCDRDESCCALKEAMGEVRSAIVSILERRTVADLCRRAREMRAACPVRQ